VSDIAIFQSRIGDQYGINLTHRADFDTDEEGPITITSCLPMFPSIIIGVVISYSLPGLLHPIFPQWLPNQARASSFVHLLPIELLELIIIVYWYTPIVTWPNRQHASCRSALIEYLRTPLQLIGTYLHSNIRIPNLFRAFDCV
jgi:hypothetical protein